MFSKAEELFSDVNTNVISEMLRSRDDLKLTYEREKNKLEEAIKLYHEAINHGHKSAHISLIECYKILHNFGQCAFYYDILINKLNYDNYVGEFVDEYERAMKFDSHTSKSYLLIEVLIKSKSERAHVMLVKYSHLITEEMLERLMEFVQTASVVEHNPNILNNLLLIFNSNNLLYQKYITKLLSAYSVYQNVKNIIHGEGRFVGGKSNH